MKRLMIGITLIAGIIAGCASEKPPINTTNLQALQGLSREDITSRSPQVSKIRLKAIKETAMTLGAQGGLAWRSGQIDHILAHNNKMLSHIFNFNGLMLNQSVLPPVLEQSKESLNLSDPRSLRIADRTYKIVHDARFVTTPPTWDQYIWMKYKKPELPDSTLLPRNSEERAIWEKNVQIGWAQGIAQANDIYAANLARLKRDYKGMMLYRKLLSQNMLTKPKVAKFNMGITTANNNTELRINDEALQITAVPKFDVSHKKWKPVLEQTP